MKRTFVIGDIHGCCEELNNLLEVIDPDLRKDRLVLLGDYIDRGPDSFGVICKLMKLQNRFGPEKVVLLRGNHEQMAIDYCRNESSVFLWNGGKETLRSFARYGKDLKSYIDFFEQLPLYFEDEHFIYVHGGIRHGVKLEEQCAADLLWLREEFIFDPHKDKKPVFFGHTPTIWINGTYKPFFTEARIGIDTGCVYGGYLSAVEIQRRKVVSVYRTRKEAHSGNFRNKKSLLGRVSVK